MKWAVPILLALSIGCSATNPASFKVQTNTSALIAPPESTVTVRGEVAKPGNYPLTPNLQLMEAVADAGGQTRYSTGIVAIVRDGRTIFEHKILDIREGKTLVPKLQPGDVILITPK